MIHEVHSLMKVYNHTVLLKYSTVKKVQFRRSLIERTRSVVQTNESGK